MYISQEAKSKIKTFDMENMSITDLKDMRKRFSRRRDQVSCDIWSATTYVLDQGGGV